MADLAQHNLNRMFQVRCSPDCPYEDCVILTNMPPGKGEGDGDSSETDNSDSMDSSDSDGGKDNKTVQKDEKSREESDGRDNQPDDDDARKPEEGSRPERDKPDNSEGNDESPPEDDAREKSDPQESPEGNGRPEEVSYTPVFKEPGFGYAPPIRPLDRQAPPPEVVMSDRVFETRLKNVMTDNSFDRPVKGRKRGKLDMRALYKVPMKAENVFTLKEARKNKRYNVLLLVDESGSMDGIKATTAARCAVFLAKSFEGININVAIVGFNLYVTTRKEFEGEADYLKIFQSIESLNNYSGISHNNDWDALNKAYQMFDKAPEGKNILIMLSDGEPVSQPNPQFRDIRGKVETAPKGTNRLKYYQKDERAHLHHLVNGNSRKVESIGIGITQGGWQIPNHAVVRSVDQLKPVLIKELQQRIKRG